MVYSGSKNLKNLAWHTLCYKLWYKCTTSYSFFDESFVSPCNDELNNVAESVEAGDMTENDI